MSFVFSFFYIFNFIYGINCHIILYSYILIFRWLGSQIDSSWSNKKMYRNLWRISKKQKMLNKIWYWFEIIFNFFTFYCTICKRPTNPQNSYRTRIIPKLWNHSWATTRGLKYIYIYTIVVHCTLYSTVNRKFWTY